MMRGLKLGQFQRGGTRIFCALSYITLVNVIINFIFSELSENIDFLNGIAYNVKKC